MVEVPKMRENGRISSSPGLSSPPTPSSPTNAKAPTHSPFVTSVSCQPHDGQFPANRGGGDTASEAADAKNILAPVKKPRKKRDPNNTAKKRAEAKNGITTPNPTMDATEVVVKQRKPRVSRGTAGTGRRSKANPVTHADVASGQSKITDNLAPSQQLTTLPAPPKFLASQTGNHEAIPTPPDSKCIPPHIQQLSTPRISGQNYDPIRSSTVEPRPKPPTTSNQHLRSPTSPRPIIYGSASNSPAISSLIDPPSHIRYPSLKRDSDSRGPSSPPKKLRMTPPEDAVAIQQVPEPPHRLSLPSNGLPITNNAPMPMDVDKSDPAPVKAPAVARKSTGTSGTSTPAATKAARQKEAPVASGNGLLSSALFGGPVESTGSEKTAPTIVIDVNLHGENNMYVNFARLAEERYGFNALHPRLAAQRERLARVAAAGAALENAEKKANGGASADDMSVDLSEGEAAGDDSNVEMGGISLIERDVLGQGGSPADGSEGPKKRKKRVMKEDQYDKEDPFVDDTELAWEEQAAASKDGFFVYSGPLVPEGEKPNVERYVSPLATSDL